MYSEETLPIVGYGDDRVPNTFVRQSNDTTKLAILLPGMGYSCDMPLFYYAETLSLGVDADVLRVEYAYSRQPGFRDLPAPEKIRRLLTDTVAAREVAFRQRPYERVIFVGKSLGTLAMGHLLTTGQQAKETRAVWLTPLLRNEALRQQIQQYAGPSLFAIGTSDHDYDPAYVQEVQAATSGEAVIVDDADHSLDIEGDVRASLHALTRVLTSLEKFLAA